MILTPEEKEQFVYALKVTGEQYLKRNSEIIEEVSEDENEGL